MKRRLLSAFLAVMMVLTMAPVAFAGNEEAADSTSGSTGADSVDSGSTSGGSDSGETATVVAKIGDTGYATLAEAVAAAKDDSTITLLKDADTAVLKANVIYDLAGHVFTYTGGTFSYADKQTVSFVDSSVSGSKRGGTLKLTGVRGTMAAINPMTGAILNVNNLNVECTGSAFFPQGDATAVNITNCDVKSAVYCVGTNAGTTDNYNVVITLKDSTFTSTANDKDDCTVMINVAGNLNIENCVITGDRQGVTVRAGVARINNSEITTTGGYSNREQYYSGSWKSGNEVPAAALTVGNYSQNGASAYLAEANVCLDNTKLTGKNKFPALYVDGNRTYSGRVLIKGENTAVSGDVKIGQNAGCVDVNIYDGLFTMDVSEYCADGLTALNNDNATYKYKVDKIPTESAGKIKAEADKTVETKPTVADNIKTEDKSAAAAVASNTTVKLDASDVTEEDKMAALDKLKGTDAMVNGNIAEGKNVTVEKKTYLDVKVEKCEIDGKTPETYLVSMDITPRYNLTLKVEGKNSGGSTTLKQGEELKNVGKTDVSVTLPTQFASQKVYITHKGKSVTEYLTANATDTGVVNFTVNGFSPITFTLVPDSAVVAEVNGNTYTSLQDAANAAKDGDEIAVVKNDKLDLTFNTTKSVKVTNKTNDKITVKFNGTDKEIDKDHTETFSYTKPSSGGSSGGSSSGKTTYKVTTSAVNNGGVNASPSSAEKGATITITLSPDKGYKLDKLTVTDGSGKTVSTVKKSDTVYTFTMPASAVKVGVSYVKATETPSKTKFNDVSANDWFASAVDYVTGKGMMNGTADNTFSPKANTTRGMVVTVLYRLENQPSTSAASFTDVASGAYYANAVAWANANGIVSGYGSGKFGPNDKVTREQLAAILYRYAQYKKYDVSGANSLDGYTDVQSVSSYAVPALQWANAAGVVTGKSGSKLDPKGNATRAEVAAMLMRFCENVK